MLQYTAPVMLASIGSLLLQHGEHQVISIHDISKMQLQSGDQVIWVEAHGIPGYLHNIPAIPIPNSRYAVSDYIRNMGLKNLKNIDTLHILACSSGVQANLPGVSAQQVSVVDGAIAGLEAARVVNKTVIGYNGLFINNPIDGKFYVVDPTHVVQA